MLPYRFRVGDRVLIKKKIPMGSHFISGKMATIYEVNSSGECYSLIIDGHGACSWYPQDTLIFKAAATPKTIRQVMRENAEWR
jgi:hypothetical protein